LDTAQATTTAVIIREAGVSIFPVTQSQDGFPEEKVLYTFNVTNEGNYTDTFTLETIGAWSSTLSTDTIGPLGVGESFELTLEVTIPSSAEPHSNDTTTIIVRSDFDPAVLDTAHATTTAILRQLKLYIPLIIR
jgi:hypothetical protein